MPVFSHARTIHGVALALGLLAIPVSVFADVMHFHDGTVLRGKVKDATGELIEFHSGGLFGSTQNIPRLHLSNRNDLVETIGHHTYYGEIVYIDDFHVDLQTKSGILKISRWKIKNIVVGTPMQQPSLPPNAAANNIQNISLPGQGYPNSASSMIPAVSPSVVTIPHSSDTDEDSTPALRGPRAESGDDSAIPAVGP